MAPLTIQSVADALRPTHRNGRTSRRNASGPITERQIPQAFPASRIGARRRTAAARPGAPRRTVIRRRGPCRDRCADRICRPRNRSVRIADPSKGPSRNDSCGTAAPGCLDGGQPGAAVPHGCRNSEVVPGRLQSSAIVTVRPARNDPIHEAHRRRNDIGPIGEILVPQGLPSTRIAHAGAPGRCTPAKPGARRSTDAVVGSAPRTRRMEALEPGSDACDRLVAGGGSGRGRLDAAGAAGGGRRGGAAWPRSTRRRRRRRSSSTLAR